MTYLRFLAVFILPILGLFAYLRWRGPEVQLHRPQVGALLLCILAVAYTTPWDNYLVARGVWSYEDERILAAWRLGYVPLEEYFFFVLQTVLTTLIFLHFAARDPASVQLLRQPADRSIAPRLLGAAAMLGFSGIGVYALSRGGHWLYFGLIAAWAGPVLALQWGLGGACLWAVRALATRALLFGTVYLWVVDAIAIQWKIWIISERYSSGAAIVGLPLEEALFFLVTNLLVIQGLVLFFHYSVNGWRLR